MVCIVERARNNSREALAPAYILRRFLRHRTLIKEAHIRRFAVGLLAFAALAAAGYLLTRRRPALAAIAGGKAKVSTRQPVEDLYAAGL